MCSKKSLITWEIQIKTTSHLLSKKQKVANAGKDGEEKEPFIFCKIT
jgi:hypothetical protein